MYVTVGDGAVLRATWGVHGAPAGAPRTGRTGKLPGPPTAGRHRHRPRRRTTGSTALIGLTTRRIGRRPPAQPAPRRGARRPDPSRERLRPRRGAGRPGAMSHFDLARKDCLGTARNARRRSGSRSPAASSRRLLPDHRQHQGRDAAVRRHRRQHVHRPADPRHDVHGRARPTAGMACRGHQHGQGGTLPLVTDYVTDPRATASSCARRCCVTGPQKDLKVYVRYDGTVNGNGGGGDATTAAPTRRDRRLLAQRPCRSRSTRRPPRTRSTATTRSRSSPRSRADRPFPPRAAASPAPPATGCRSSTPTHALGATYARPRTATSSRRAQVDAPPRRDLPAGPGLRLHAEAGRGARLPEAARAPRFASLSQRATAAAGAGTTRRPHRPRRTRGLTPRAAARRCGAPTVCGQRAEGQ